jgi:hypothetical protein
LTHADLDVVNIDRRDPTADAEAQTRPAMRAGVSVTVQGPFSYGGWTERPDILRRVEVPSTLWSRSYEGATWVDREGAEEPLTLNDIMIVTPYNAQFFEIQQRAGRPCRHG